MENTTIGVGNFTFSKMSKDPKLLYSFFGISVIGAIVNSMFLIVLLSCHSLRRPANYPLMLLSLASLIFIMSTTLWVTSFHTTPGSPIHLLSSLPLYCSILAMARKFPQTIISWTTICIIQDRKVVGRNPLARPNPCTAIQRLLRITCLSLLLALPHGFQFNFSLKQDRCKKVLLFGSDLLTIAYQLFFLLLTHIYPSIVLIKAMWSSREVLRRLFSRRESVVRIQDTGTQLIVASCIFSTAFLICWPLMGVFHFLNNIPTGILSRKTKSSIENYWKYTRPVSYAYSCANPTLLVILCYDWKWTTFVSFVTRIARK